MEILRMLYSEGEAELIVRVFTAPYQDAITAEQAAERAGSPVEEVRRKLDRLASRGLVMKFRHWSDGSEFEEKPILSLFRPKTLEESEDSGNKPNQSISDENGKEMLEKRLESRWAA